MTKFTFKIKSIPGGLAIGAVAEDGEVIAEFFKTTTRAPRDADSSYNVHRLAKGDCFEQEDHFEFVGRHAEVLEVAQQQLPQAYRDAQWALRKTNDRDDWAVFNFVEGLTAGGCCWFGSTPAKTVAAVKKARATLAFEI